MKLLLTLHSINCRKLLAAPAARSCASTTRCAYLSLAIEIEPSPSSFDTVVGCTPASIRGWLRIGVALSTSA